MRYDVAIIGGGFSGSIVAASLTRSAPGAKVLLIEREQYRSRISGCEVCEGASVVVARFVEDRVDAIQVSGARPEGADRNGWVSARHYVDASGAEGVLARYLGATASVPSPRKKISIWSTWRVSKWPAKWPRAQVREVFGGALWLLRLSAERVSVGFVAPADIWENVAETRAEIYAAALGSDPQVVRLLSAGQPLGEIRSRSGCPNMPGRTIGENWVLVGESAGIENPVCAQGIALIETDASHAATLISVARKRVLPLNDRLCGSVDSRVHAHLQIEESWHAQRLPIAKAIL